MSSAIWNLNKDELSTSYRTITIDLPGHGKSSPLPSGFSIHGCAEILAGLIIHLDLQDIILTGWSLGGQIAIASHTLLRERISGLVLIGTTPRFISTADYPYGLHPAEAEGMALKVRRNIVRALAGFTAGMFSPEELNDSIQTALIQDLLESITLPDTSTALQALQALVSADMRDSLPLIHLPTLIMSGEQDDICLPGASSFMLERISLAHQVVFSGCGHAPFLTQPERFSSFLKVFAESVRKTGAR